MARTVHIYLEGDSDSVDSGGTGIFLCGDNDSVGKIVHNLYEKPMYRVPEMPETICPQCLDILGPLKQLANTEL